MLETITAYGIGKFIHVLAVVVAFGPTFAYGFIFAIAGEAGLRSLIVAMRTTNTIDKYLVSPGSILVLVAGFYLVSKGNWDLGTFWIDVGIVAILVLIGMIHGFFRPRGKQALALAERDLAAGDQPSAELEALNKQLTLGGQLAGVIIVVALFFMVVKP